MTIRVDRNIYTDECISKSVYSLADKCVILRTIVNEQEEEFFVMAKSKVDDSILKAEIISRLNDYKLRCIIEKETHDIRTILYAKAFADCDDL